MYPRLYDTAIRLGELQAEFKLQITPEEFAKDNLKFGLVEVVYEWAKVPFFSEDTNLNYGLVWFLFLKTVLKNSF